MSFKDHFSGHAADYARYRPTYPSSLFEFLAAHAPGRRLAWDCATGNGQVAVALVGVMERVVASDASIRQVEQGESHPRVSYRVEHAERCSLPDACTDLVTCAQALHWLDVDRFNDEVRRVLRPGGLFAAWCYANVTVTPEVDAVVARLYRDLVGPYWPAERRIVESGYRDLPFPFERIAAPDFLLDAQWSLERFAGYLGTWSASRRYREARGRDPVAEIAGDLARAWGPESARSVRWPLSLRVGRAA